ncbi:MAG: hypothetical protein SOZ98_02235 [Sodaliphilus sp.]|nr:hypothetical protein [Sodaliphilus sp.]
MVESWECPYVISKKNGNIAPLPTFSVLSKYHVPTRFGFSPKASGFYPFGDATARPSLGGGIAKRLFFMFLFLCPQYFSTEPKLDFNGLNRCSRFI